MRDCIQTDDRNFNIFLYDPFSNRKPKWNYLNRQLIMKL